MSAATATATAAAPATATPSATATDAKAFMTAVRIAQTGGPEVLSVDEKTPVPVVGPKDVLVRVAAAGINFIDTYQRKGMYPVKLPHTLGREAAGIIEGVGAEAGNEFKVGARVVFFGEYSYAQFVSIPAEKAIPVPPGMSLLDATALLLQGMTAHAMMTSTYVVKPGDTILIQAGAGGTGQLLVQIAKIKGARVITTVGSKDKEKIAASVGADLVINYTETDFVEAVKKYTGGKGCNAVYDGVGAATAMKSLKCCAQLGHLVLFGNASGKVPPIDPLDLMNAGSVSLTRPTVFHYLPTREVSLARSNDLFTWVAQGKLKVSVGKTFPLSGAADAHRFLESRASTGKIVLIVDNKLAKL